MNVVNALNREQVEHNRQSPFNRVYFIFSKVDMVKVAMILAANNPLYDSFQITAQMHPSILVKIGINGQHMQKE